MWTSVSPDLRAAGLGIDVERVSRRFEGAGAAGIQALQDVSITVQPRELVAVVGASGCGKTTLLRIVGGLDRPTSGSVAFLDEGGTAVSIAPRDLGFCFQDPRLLPWRCARDNAALPLELAGVGRAERRRRADEALSLVRLGGRERSLPATLSGGMRMRVALARAIVTRPRVLLLDEPFSALDEVTRMELDGELLRLREATGATILLVTHAISEAVLLADRIVVLGAHPGRVRSVITVDLPQRGLDRRASPGLAPLAARILDLIAERGDGATTTDGAPNQAFRGNGEKP